ncbi:hypothetical protein TYRP_016708 [Tyrophagus putrescentiae]|nr:hypothetical protein TYRP_016708 [Tyrophagus putrescentiae]
MAKLLTFVFFSVVAIQLASCNVDPQIFAPDVELANGRVRGLVENVNGKQVHVYQGIRYGTAKRFEKPQAVVEKWSPFVYDATRKRECCSQYIMPQNESDILVQTKVMSEDCLYLNVWRPAHHQNSTTTSKLPVLVFLHGGAFTVGSIFSEYFDGKHIASQGNVIVVTLAYRLGALGLLYAPGLVPSNLALYDQRLGLQWIKQNVAHFGGDPSLVTLAGSSSGSISHPNSDLVKSPQTALAATKELVFRLNCSSSAAEEPSSSSIACLRRKSAEEISNGIGLNHMLDGVLFWPVYGDENLPTMPGIALKEGKFNRNIDVLYGVSDREGSYFAAQALPKLLSDHANLTVASTRADIADLVTKIWKKDYAKEVVDFYTGDLVNCLKVSEEELKIIYSNVWGDYILTCPTILFAQQLAEHSPPGNRYYSYRLMNGLHGKIPAQKWMGVMHGQDWLVFFKVPFVRTAEEAQLSNDVISAFASFISTGDPGKIGGQKAQQYGMVSGQYHRACDQFWKDKITQV